MGPTSIRPFAVLALALSPVLAQEPTRAVDLLDNGDFEDPVAMLAEPNGATPIARIPWWTPVVLPDAVSADSWQRAERGWASLQGRDLPSVESGELRLGVDPLVLLAQPVAAYAPLVSELVVTGRVQGQGIVVLVDGSGRELRQAVGSEDGGWMDFTWRPAETLPDLVPRMTLAVSSYGGGPCSFDDLEVRVALPSPGAADLAAELDALLVTTLDQLYEGGRDRFGPRESAFWVGLHDVDTGAFRGGGSRGAAAAPFGRVGLSPLNSMYLEAVALGVGGEVFAARLETLATEFLTSCIHPGTGLPRRYDPIADSPVDGEAIEVAAYLEHLIDLAAGGVEPGHGEPLRSDVLPPELQAAARDAAVRMGRRLLADAVLPDGNVAALLRPADGHASTSVVHLRILDVPAQLVRLAALCRDLGIEAELQAELVAAAREAVLEVEFANLWPGTWKTIDPGFDDTYGHIGERSMAMAGAWPSEPAFGRLVRTGRSHFEPLWSQALEHGGNIAADQVRCWRILAELTELDVRLASASADADGAHTATLLHSAARNHFKGEQTTTGAWLDVTIVGHDPKTNLPVGDVIGLPQNLLEGLAVAHGAQLDEDVRAELRALFTTLLRSTTETYGAPYGFAGGDRSSAGSVRILAGLMAMLGELRHP